MGTKKLLYYRMFNAFMLLSLMQDFFIFSVLKIKFMSLKMSLKISTQPVYEY